MPISGHAELRLVYSSEEIAKAVGRVAAEIDAAYAGAELLLVVVLKGSFLFAADLVRHLQRPVEIEFVQLASYEGKDSSGTVVMRKELTTPVRGRNILIVEDIVDTGLSLQFLLSALKQKEPASIKVCTLLDKRERRKVPVEADFVGIACSGGFLVGYGLDLDERYRQLPEIYELMTP